MIIIYHGSHPLLPMTACIIHLGNKIEWEGASHNWKTTPLIILGQDESNHTIGCLVHGKYKPLFRHALAGVAGMFDITVRFVDTELLFFGTGRMGRFLIPYQQLLARWFPYWCSRLRRMPLEDLLRERICQ